MSRRPTFVLAAGAVACVLASLIERRFPNGTIGRALDVNSEQNLPTWYSASLLLLVALAFGLAGLLAPIELRRWWWLVAALMLALSIDEVVGLHEELGDLGDDIVSRPRGLLHFAWIIPGAIVGGCVALAFVHLARQVPRRTATWLLAGIGLFLGGAFGGEALSGAVLDAYGDADLYGAVTAAEELAEMLGAVAMLQAASTIVTPARTPAGLELRYDG